MYIRDLLALGATRGELARLTIYTLLFTLFEGVGIGLLLPVLDYVAQGEIRLNPESWPILSGLLNLSNQQSGRTCLVLLLLLAFGSLILRSVFHYIQDFSGAKLALKVSANLRQQAVDSFLHSDFAFLSATGTGELFSALTMEAARAGEAMKAQIVFLTSFALLLVYFLLLVWLSPRLVLLTIPVFILAVLVFRRLRRVLGELGQGVSRLNNRFSRLVGEHLRGMDRVKMRAQEATAASALQQTIEDLAVSSLSIERWRLLVDIGMFPVLVLSAFGVLFVAVEVLRLSLSSLGLFLFILIRLAPQFTLLNGIWSHIHSCLASFQDLTRLIETARSHKESWGGNLKFEHLVNGLTIQGLNFTYPDVAVSAPALQNCSCFIPRGSLTALVGRSGAGKSTLVKLVVGFYRPQDGDILVDGISLNQFDLAAWRRKLAYLTQEPFLFDESVRANLNYGLARPLSTARETEVLAQSYATEFVAHLENGLETGVGEGGQRLSQGQKQRLALAHALAVEPQLLLLDEPTSALDSESEEAIQQTLMDLRGRLTMIVIAHRLSTIRQADQIILLDQGCVVAQGRHEDLLKRSELYRSLFDRQVII